MSFKQLLLLVIFVSLSACAPALAPGSDLQVEEHRLAAPPAPEPFSFEPVEGSMQEVLAAHDAQRSRLQPRETMYVDGQPAVLTRLGSHTLIALYQREALADVVIVQMDGRPIYRVETGMPSPIDGLRGLWTYDGHWVLETAFVKPEAYGGRLTRDGVLLGPYEEAFDFQLIRGRPFYFFKQDGTIDLFFDGRELLAGYDEVPHYRCCSESSLNPLHAESMLAFFARRGMNWYYVEAGLFGE